MRKTIILMICLCFSSYFSVLQAQKKSPKLFLSTEMLHFGPEFQTGDIGETMKMGLHYGAKVYMGV